MGVSGGNAVEDKNGFLSLVDLVGDPWKYECEVDWSSGGCVGDLSGEGGSAAGGKLGGRAGLGVSPLRRRWAGDKGVEKGPGVGGVVGYVAGHLIRYAASAAFQKNNRGMAISTNETTFAAK